MTKNERALEASFLLCKVMVEGVGFELPPLTCKFNNRLKTTLGQCRKNTRTKEMWIEVNPKHFERYTLKEDFKTINHTMLHELCHALPNSFNHGATWKHNIGVINRTYGYNIDTKHPSDEVCKEVRMLSKTGGEAKCINCGCTTMLTPHQVKNIFKYRCRNCKSSFKLI